MLDYINLSLLYILHLLHRQQRLSLFVGLALVARHWIVIYIQELVVFLSFLQFSISQVKSRSSLYSFEKEMATSGKLVAVSPAPPGHVANFVNLEIQTGNAVVIGE